MKMSSAACKASIPGESIGQNSPEGKTSASLALLQRFFLHRSDVVAFLAPWGKACPSDTLTPADLESALLSHLAGVEAPLSWKTSRGSGSQLGRWRLGAYVVGTDNRTGFTCLDFDGKGHAAALTDPLGAALAALEAARGLGFRPYLEKSGGGSGWHLWVFFAEPIPAKDARRIGQALTSSIPQALTALQGGGFANVKKNEGIEVFPKQDSLSKGGLGNLVWLPWWRGAPEGANRFYEPSETPEGVTLSDPQDFEAAPAEVISRALESIPEEKPAARPVGGLVASIKPSGNTKKSRAKSEGARAWKEWRERALARLPLEAVYGGLLTGRYSGAGWLECRDPSSPSGDKNPSAGVADGSGEAERGKFSSHRTRDAISVLDFLIWRGEARDINEAQRRVADLSGVPLPKEAPPEAEAAPDDLLAERYVSQLEAAKARESATPPRSLAEAAPALREAVREAEAKNGLTAIKTPAGAGKTEAAIDVLLTLPGRSAYHVPTHDLAREVFQRFTAKGARVRRDFSGPSKNGLLDAAGLRVCSIPLEVIEAELATGRTSKEICSRCPERRRGCLAAEGYEGPEDAPVIISAHTKPVVEEDVDRFVIDETPEVLKDDRVTLGLLEELVDQEHKRIPSIHREQRDVLCPAALEVILWRQAGAPHHTDPLAKFRADLQALCTQAKGPPRALVRLVALWALDGEEIKYYSGADSGAWKAARWLLAAALEGASLSPCKIKGEQGILFFSPSRLVRTLKKRDGGAILLDATPTQGALSLLSHSTGKPAELVSIEVKDGAPIERVWVVTTNGKRSYVVNPHGQPLYEGRLATLVTDASRALTERPQCKNVLLITHRPLALALRLAWAAVVGFEPLEEDARAWRKLFPTAALAEQSAKEASRAFAPLLAPIKARGGQLGVGWFGALRGLDVWKDFDTCICLGDPWGDLGSHQEEREWRRRAGAGDLDLDPEADWASYLEAAAAELAQAFGRLRAPSRALAAVFLHFGSVLPLDWQPSGVHLVPPRPSGRPARETPEGVSPADVLGAALAKAGSKKALARVLEIDPRTLRRYLSEEIAPPVETLARAQEYAPSVEVEEGGAEIAIAIPLSSLFSYSNFCLLSESSGIEAEQGGQESTATQLEEAPPPDFAPLGEEEEERAALIAADLIGAGWPPDLAQEAGTRAVLTGELPRPARLSRFAPAWSRLVEAEQAATPG